MIKMFDKNHKMLFHYQLNIGDDYNISISKVKKLVSNISNKEQHIFYYKNLKLYL